MPDIIYHGKSQDIFFKGKLYNRKEKIEGNYNKIECTKEVYESLAFYDNSTIYVVTYPDESVHFYLGSEEIAGNPTLINKIITANGTYSAEDDGADGYSAVRVNVNSVDISPDLMGYTGDTDLGNGFTVVNSAGTIESGTWTINGHDYSGLRLFGSSTLQTPFIPWSVPGTSIEAKIVIKAWNSSNAHRDFSPKYGSDGAWTFSLYTVYSSSYICYNIDGCIVIDTDNLVRQGSYSDYNDISLPKQNVLGTEIWIRLESDGEYITMYVNEVAKAKKPITTDMWRMSVYSIGGNGTDCDDIILTKAKVHIEKEA